MGNTGMTHEWSDSQPIYRQLRDRGVHMILDGVLKEGDPLPSVRNVAAEYRVNPLTVLKGYQQLVDEGLVESKRGLGMFINAGARSLLLQGERQKFLGEEWPDGCDDILHATPVAKQVAVRCGLRHRKRPDLEHRRSNEPCTPRQSAYVLGNGHPVPVDAAGRPYRRLP